MGIIIPGTWLLGSVGLWLTCATLLLQVHASEDNGIKYSIFGSKPQVLGSKTASIETESLEAQALDRVFAKYNCPFEGYGHVFVKEAEKSGIPFWLVASISFQESSCGKNTPKDLAGDTPEAETYNAWGWGVWGKNVRTFTDWNEGIATVSKYMGTKFYSKGITDTCEIMTIYTPPSNGSWCNGVNHFGDLFQKSLVEIS